MGPVHIIHVSKKMKISIFLSMRRFIKNSPAMGSGLASRLSLVFRPTVGLMPDAERSSTMAEETHDAPADQHGEPPDGLCCLCTMEDITLEDQNYGTLGNAR